MKKRTLFAACLLAGLLVPAAAFAAAPPPAFTKYATRAVDAARITHRNFIGGMNSRLTVINETIHENPEDPSAPWGTALYEPVDRVWIGAVATGAKLTGDGGYDFNAYGFNTGYDWTKGDFLVGVAAAYTKGTIESREIDTRNKVETAHIGVHAARDPVQGLYYDANAAYGRSWNRSLSREVAEGAGHREGRFSATSYGAGGNIGYGFDLAFAKVTPTAGLQWTRYRQDAYTELAGVVTPHWFAEAENDVVEIPLAVRIGTSWQMLNGAILSPEVRAAYIFQAGDRESSVTMGAAGSSGGTLRGVEDGRPRARLGAGLKANFSPTFDAFVDYNLELRSGYRSTNFNTGLGLSF